MEQNSNYQAIFKRKAIRKYDLTPFDDKTLTEISDKIQRLQPLYNNIKTEFKIVSENNVKNAMSIKAPHYIVVFSEVKEGYLTNAGFMLQQMDLFLSVNGIGTCWLGMPKPTKEILNSSNLEFIIMLAFGKPTEPLYRESTSEFKRKSIDQITNASDAHQLLEAVRLAPSGINSQPWFFTGDKNTLHAYCMKSGFLKALIYERMNKIDMGIGLCHLWVAAKNIGKEVEFFLDNEVRNNPPSGYYYNTSIKIK